MRMFMKHPAHAGCKVGACLLLLLLSTLLQALVSYQVYVAYVALESVLVQIPDLLLKGCVILGKLFNSSVSQLSHA